MDTEQIRGAMARVAKSRLFVFGVVDAEGRLVSEHFENVESAREAARTRRGGVIAYPRDRPDGERVWVRRAAAILKRKRAEFVDSFRISTRQFADSQRLFLTDSTSSDGWYEVWFVMTEIAYLKWIGRAATPDEAETLARAWLRA